MPMYEERFLSPGTWTKPSTVTQVEVFVVGGGGSSGVLNGGAGGGGVVRKVIPVTGPVPVTVGAGGAAIPMVSPTSVGNQGGTSGFGPLGPGPIPTIPPTTVAAGGGGASVSPGAPAPLLPTANAPAIGGGGGLPLGTGGLGYPANPQTGAGGMGSSSWIKRESPTYGPNQTYHGRGLYGFGGAGSNGTIDQATVYDGGGSGPFGSGTANTGGGGAATGGAGGSGIVIVRFWQ